MIIIFSPLRAGHCLIAPALTQYTYMCNPVYSSCCFAISVNLSRILGCEIKLGRMPIRRIRQSIRRSGQDVVTRPLSKFLVLYIMGFFQPQANHLRWT